jgi:hypothetical protein
MAPQRFHFSTSRCGCCLVGPLAQGM